MKLFIKNRNVSGKRRFLKFWDNFKTEHSHILDEVKNKSGDIFIFVDIKDNNKNSENFAFKLLNDFNATELNDNLSVKFPDKSMTIRVYKDIMDIVSADTKLSVLKNKRNHFVKLKTKIENQMEAAQNTAARFGMYDDCGESYIRESQDADARYDLMKEMEMFIPEQDVIDQSRIVGTLKQRFKTKHPEFHPTMLAMLSDNQRKRESIAQDNLKRRKTIYKSAANLVMAMDGLIKEAKENKTPLPKSIKEQIKFAASTTMTTFNHSRNPVKQLPEHFRNHPERVESVVSVAREVASFDMAKERKKLINSLLNKIETAKKQYIKD
jgi:hypothetical protein